MTRWLVIAMLFACRSGEKRAPMLANASSASPVFAVTACPRLNFVVLQWIHELFPGCPTMPLLDDDLDDRTAICGDECPRPCRVTRNADVERDTYDAAGRWIESRHDGWIESCRYKGDKAAVCSTTSPENPKTWIAQRDANGRLTGIARPGYSVDVTYDAHGDVSRVAVGGDSATYTYDEAHRLVAETDVQRGETYDSTYRYASGRLVERQGSAARTSYHYDSTGRLSTVVMDRAASHRVLTYTYDAVGRVARDAELGGASEVTRSFDYDCRRE